MERDLFINNHLRIPGSELTVTTSRSGGPGGQHVQKTDSKVTLRWNIAQSSALSDEVRNRLMRKLERRLTVLGEVVIQVESERSQKQNREIARERLAEIVLKALRLEKPRKKTKPSARAKAHRVDQKKILGSKKQLRTKQIDHY